MRLGRLADLIAPGGILKVFGSHSCEWRAEGRQCGVHNCHILIAGVDKNIQIFCYARFGEVGDRISSHDRDI